MSSRAVPRRLEREQTLDVAQLRRYLFENYGERCLSADEPPHPVAIFTALFFAEPDRSTRARVRRAYERLVETPDAVDGDGFIYCFRDIRDQDHRALVKIGETSRMPERRLGEWSEQLMADTSDTLTIVFAYRCALRQLVERVVFALLWYRRDALRVNTATDRHLGEYFRIDSLTRTKVLVDAIVRHTNWYRQLLASRYNAYSPHTIDNKSANAPRTRSATAVCHMP